MNACDTSISPRFTPGAAPYAKLATVRLLWRMAWLPAAAIVAAALAGFADSRYWYLGLMLVFIVYPGALSMVWISFAGKHAVATLSRPQEWEFGSDALTMRFYPFENDEDTEPVSVLSVPYSALHSLERSGQWLVVESREGFQGFPFALIPADSFPKTLNINE